MSRSRGPKYQHLFKIIIVGAGKVGKTSLTIRFAEDRFRESYLPTLGVDFLTKNLTADGKQIKLQLWDTGGQEFVMSLLPFYFFSHRDAPALRHGRQWLIVCERLRLW